MSRRNPDRLPKAGERAKKLLEADLEDRPAATLAERCECLRRVTGLRVSETTVSRLLKRVGWTRKKIGGCERGEFLRATWRALVVGRSVRSGSGGRRREGFEHLACAPVRLGTQEEPGALLDTAQPRQDHDGSWRV
jgi:hypothetical protein